MSTEPTSETTDPELRDFRVTPEEYALYAGKENKRLVNRLGFFLYIVIGLVIFLVTRVVTHDWGTAISWGVGSITIGFMLTVPAALGTATAIERAITRRRRTRLLQSPVASRIKQYKAAKRAHQEAEQAAWNARREAERQQQQAERARQAALLAEQRKHQEYWQSLSGIEFEQELAKLFRARGYHVQFTPTTGDQGIDLIARKNGKTTVVQCKAYKHPVGPAVARELYGSMVAYGANDAILACTGGFTKGVEEFVQRRPIKLISVSDLVRVAEATGDGDTKTESPPVCPFPECGRTMVLEEGRYGIFWKCPKPRCIGKRDA